jgi:translation initiation factor 2 subunit 2
VHVRTPHACIVSQSLLHENNPELSERSRITLKPPQLMRMGTRKTVWANFQEICKLMKRSPEHVFSFVVAELGTEGSVDGNQRLVSIKHHFLVTH